MKLFSTMLNFLLAEWSDLSGLSTLINISEVAKAKSSQHRKCLEFCKYSKIFQRGKKRPRELDSCEYVKFVQALGNTAESLMVPKRKVAIRRKPFDRGVSHKCLALWKLVSSQNLSGHLFQHSVLTFRKCKSTKPEGNTKPSMLHYNTSQTFKQNIQKTVASI